VRAVAFRDPVAVFGSRARTHPQLPADVGGLLELLLVLVERVLGLGELVRRVSVLVDLVAQLLGLGGALDELLDLYAREPPMSHLVLRAY
jgi:hypothetical protein